MAELAVGEMMIGGWVCCVRQCNEAGERFLEFCALNQFTIRNTWFEKKQRHLLQQLKQQLGLEEGSSQSAFWTQQTPYSQLLMRKMPPIQGIYR